MNGGGTGGLLVVPAIRCYLSVMMSHDQNYVLLTNEH